MTLTDNGRKLTISAGSQEELESALGLAREFIEAEERSTIVGEVPPWE
jgi:hypothetical protein